MTVFETLVIMISFAKLIVVMLLGQKITAHKTPR